MSEPVPEPTPDVVNPSDVDMNNPNLRPEDQEVEMEPVILTPGAYASPDPATSGQVMVSLEVAEEAGMELSPDYAQDELSEPAADGEDSGNGGTVQSVDYNAMTVTDLKAELDNRGISYASNASKADLISLLEDDDAGV
jgi:hypothetical protein